MNKATSQTILTNKFKSKLQAVAAPEENSVQDSILDRSPSFPMPGESSPQILSSQQIQGGDLSEMMKMQLQLANRMQEMQEMFEEKLKKMKQKNKEKLKKAVEDHVRANEDLSDGPIDKVQRFQIHQNQFDSMHSLNQVESIGHSEPIPNSSSLNTVPSVRSMINQIPETAQNPKTLNKVTDPLIEASLKKKDEQIQLLINQVQRLQATVTTLQQKVDTQPPKIAFVDTAIIAKKNQIKRIVKRNPNESVKKNFSADKAFLMTPQDTPKTSILVPSHLISSESKAAKRSLLVSDSKSHQYIVAPYNHQDFTSSMSKTPQLHQSTIALRRDATMKNVISHSLDGVGAGEDLFAEKYVKVTFRDYTNNTRMDIKNVDLKNQQIKRDRMIHYWQDKVASNFLPPISEKQKMEIQMRKLINEPVKVKKEQVAAAYKQKFLQDNQVSYRDSRLKQSILKPSSSKNYLYNDYETAALAGQDWQDSEHGGICDLEREATYEIIKQASSFKQ